MRMNPNAKISDEQFAEFLTKVRALAEGPFEEMQEEVEQTNVFPQRFFDLARENDFVSLRASFRVRRLGFERTGRSSKVQEEFSRGPGGMRMHLALCRRPQLAHSQRIRNS